MLPNTSHAMEKADLKKACGVEYPAAVMMNGIRLLAMCFLLTEFWAYGGEFRLSFLDNKPVLDDTCTLLQKVGFPEPTVKEFNSLVMNHNRSGHRVDLRRFPTQTDGYYVFSGFADLTNRLTNCFGRTPGNGTIEQSTFVCFDMTGLLLRGAGHAAPLLYENFSGKPILAVSPEREITPAVLTNFCKAIGALYPTNGYEYLVGRLRSEGETKLGLALSAPRRLRAGATNSDQGLRIIHADLVDQIKADGFKFPTSAQLGLVFYVDVKRGFIKPDHSFICILQGNRLITVEKTSSTGPYVRAEFENTDDIALYSSQGERDDTNNSQDVDYGSSVVVSLNEKVIGTFRPTHMR